MPPSRRDVVPIPPAASKAGLAGAAGLAEAASQPSTPIIHNADAIAERLCQTPRSMSLTSWVLRSAAVVLAVSSLSVAVTGATVYSMGVEGMMCEASCAPQVTAALSGIEGVSSVELAFAYKQARVHVRPGYSLTAEDCDRSFDNHGYFVTDFRRLP